MFVFKDRNYFNYLSLLTILKQKREKVVPESHDTVFIRKIIQIVSQFSMSNLAGYTNLLSILNLVVNIQIYPVSTSSFAMRLQMIFSFKIPVPGTKVPIL